MSTAACPRELVIPVENNYQRSHGSIAERFWRSVSKSNPDACWIWNGMRSKKGYGQLRVNSERRFAHRVSFVLHGGTLNRGDCVLHSCDNPPCVNPKHLKKGDRVDNRADCVARRRQATGEQHGQARLTRSAVEDIRLNYKRRSTPLVVFAERYGVGTSTIHRALKGECW